MERTLIEERMTKLAEELNKCQPGSEQASKIKQEMMDLWKILLEDERTVNERLDRNRRYDLDEMKYEAERREARDRDRALRRDGIIRIIEKVMIIGGAAGLLILTMAIQSGALLDSKAWALMLKILRL